MESRVLSLDFGLRVSSSSKEGLFADLRSLSDIFLSS